jgi:hypothetical protein
MGEQMSWTASAANLQVNPAPDADLLDHESFAASPPYDAMHPEPKAQFEKAVEVVDEIISSGVLGDAAAPGVGFNVQLSGHANPNHDPAQGASESFTIHITRVKVG